MATPETKTTERDFLKTIWSCKEPKIACRLSEINQFGLVGIKSSLSGVASRFVPPEPAPSWDDIQRAMDAIAKVIGNTLGVEFKYLYKAVKLMYKPHFQVLKMVEASFDKYWDTISFTRWSLDVTSVLKEKVQSYLKGTGEFDFKTYLTYFNQLEPSSFNKEMESLRLAASILAEFDSLLLNDIKELFIAITKGLAQMPKLPKPTTKPDQIALGSLLNDLQYLYLELNRAPMINQLVGDLTSHYDSWRIVEGPGRFAVENFPSTIIELEVALKKALDEINRLTSF